MTPHEINCALALERVRMLPAHPAKRFVRQMAGYAHTARATTLSDRQSAWLTALVWRHRRQIADRSLIFVCALRSRLAGHLPSEDSEPGPIQEFIE